MATRILVSSRGYFSPAVQFPARHHQAGATAVSSRRPSALLSQSQTTFQDLQHRFALFSTSPSSFSNNPRWRHHPTTMTSSEAFVETLSAHNTKHIFGIVGSAFMDALDLLPPAGIRFISVQHEQNAAHMADGYARALNGIRPGVCIAQNGPGVSNFVTGVAAAYWAHTPMVVVTPETGSLTQGLGGFQEMNQLPLFSEITKYQAHVSSPQRMAELTDRCFNYARLERGPVQLNVPRDMFYGDVTTTIPEPRVIEASAGGEQDLKRAVELLSGARNPVIISGGGVVMSNAVTDVIALAEHLHVPVCTTYLHNDAFPSDHSLWMGPLGYQGSKAAMRVVREADVILAIGTRLGPFGSLPQYGVDYWPKEAKIIQIDTNARRLGLTKKIDLGICGDAGKATQHLLTQLLNASKPAACLRTTSSRLTHASELRSNWEKELSSWSRSDGSELTPRTALRALEEALPEDVMVSTDIGNICSVANSYLRFKNQMASSPSFFAAMAFGNCGYALPAAMGAKVARPDRPAVAYVGDGAWGMSLHEMSTCVREGIPVVAVVFNNGQWGAEKKNQIDFYNNRFIGTDLCNPNFAEIAKAMGAQGITVTHRDEIKPAMTDLLASGQPGVLEVHVTKELADPFRRDALSKPIRRLDKYKEFV